MADIIKLVPPEPKDQKPVGDVVAQIELLFDLARQGAITSFAYVAVGDPTTAPAVGWSGAHRNVLIAGASQLAMEVVWKRVG